MKAAEETMAKAVSESAAGAAGATSVIPDAIAGVSRRRVAARAGGDYAQADRLRQEIVDAGFEPVDYLMAPARLCTAPAMS